MKTVPFGRARQGRDNGSVEHLVSRALSLGQDQGLLVARMSETRGILMEKIMGEAREIRIKGVKEKILG